MLKKLIKKMKEFYDQSFIFPLFTCIMILLKVMIPVSARMFLIAYFYIIGTEFIIFAYCYADEDEEKESKNRKKKRFLKAFLFVFFRSFSPFLYFLIRNPEKLTVRFGLFIVCFEIAGSTIGAYSKIRKEDKLEKKTKKV